MLIRCMHSTFLSTLLEVSWTHHATYAWREEKEASHGSIDDHSKSQAISLPGKSSES
ncbi:hypothetical protein OIU74_025825 [Salix koriyanagi]|uniref:Uncharacterized protein n=1 Tax=Salix koriyanagi TaxID=2511006 RepID=A0A9Q0W393_9ROSI|nr:hypothetical protein OIU74_025825 [Salix koriyanagi]